MFTIVFILIFNCSKSDEWRSFNNFGRSLFAGSVDIIYVEMNENFLQ